MAMFKDAPQRPELYQRFQREVPTWFRGAKFGIFVHWGAYSVPAWAEPIGELGTIDEATWFRHNPYAEWYANTIRIDGSPAQQHQKEVHGGAPYDDFLDQWTAEGFDADQVVDLFGPDRLMFGTDWPVSTLAAPYEEVVRRSKDLLRGLSASEQHAVLGDTARRTYGLVLP